MRTHRSVSVVVLVLVAVLGGLAATPGHASTTETAAEDPWGPEVVLDSSPRLGHPVSVSTLDGRTTVLWGRGGASSPLRMSWTTGDGMWTEPKRVSSQRGSGKKHEAAVTVGGPDRATFVWMRGNYGDPTEIWTRDLGPDGSMTRPELAGTVPYATRLRVAPGPDGPRALVVQRPSDGALYVLRRDDDGTWSELPTFPHEEFELLEAAVDESGTVVITGQIRFADELRAVTWNGSGWTSEVIAADVVDAQAVVSPLGDLAVSWTEPDGDTDRLQVAQRPADEQQWIVHDMGALAPRCEPRSCFAVDLTSDGDLLVVRTKEQRGAFLAVRDADGGVWLPDRRLAKRFVPWHYVGTGPDGSFVVWSGLTTVQCPSVTDCADPIETKYQFLGWPTGEIDGGASFVRLTERDPNQLLAVTLHAPE